MKNNSINLTNLTDYMHLSPVQLAEARDEKINIVHAAGM